MSNYFGSRGSFRSTRQPEEVDPMSSMSNVGDIMLVFACGLMAALVVAWNVDLGKFAQVEMDQEISQNDVEQITEQIYGEGNAFVEKGRVYQDPQTGKYYLVEDETTTGTSSPSGTTSQSGASSPSGSTSTGGSAASSAPAGSGGGQEG